MIFLETLLFTQFMKKEDIKNKNNAIRTKLINLENIRATKILNEHSKLRTIKIDLWM